MLVLSRRPNQEIVFPSVGITIKLLKTRGEIAKIGINAPRDLQVLRAEVLETQENQPVPANLSGSQISSGTHELQNQLNAARMALNLAQKQLSAGESTKAAQTLDAVVDRFSRADAIMSEKRPSIQRALLVDDDRNERELLSGYLKSFGYEIVSVGNGYEALEYLQDHELPDVVLLDMMMPVCDGPSAIQKIRELPTMHDLKVFGVSGTDPEEVGVTIGPNGVNGWFKKPLNLVELVGCLRNEISTPSISA